MRTRYHKCHTGYPFFTIEIVATRLLLEIVAIPECDLVPVSCELFSVTRQRRLAAGIDFSKTVKHEGSSYPPLHACASLSRTLGADGSSAIAT